MLNATIEKSYTIGDKMNLIKMAENLFNNPLASDAQNEYNRSQWLRSVSLLGDKWNILSPVTRKQNL